jgi:hypothetical protein
MSESFCTSEPQIYMNVSKPSCPYRQLSQDSFPSSARIEDSDLAVSLLPFCQDQEKEPGQESFPPSARIEGGNSGDISSPLLPALGEGAGG